MSVQLCYWTQNEGASGRDPSNSHVHPAETIRGNSSYIRWWSCEKKTRKYTVFNSKKKCASTWSSARDAGLRWMSHVLQPKKFHHQCQAWQLMLYFIRKHRVLVSPADSCSSHRKCPDLLGWIRILRISFCNRVWFIYDFLCRHLGNTCFLCGLHNIQGVLLA